ncbi:hypothetical protein IFT69_15225 [Pseudomonas putida]|nr:hypothetical protein [Pseudomonas putida]
MPSTILIKKKPGDGSITKLKAALSASGVDTVVIEVLGSGQSAMESLRKRVELNPQEKLNVVFDLTGIINLHNWADAIAEINRSGNIGNAILPAGTNFISVVRDDPSETFNTESLAVLVKASEWVIDAKSHNLYRDIQNQLVRDRRAPASSPEVSPYP